MAKVHINLLILWAALCLLTLALMAGCKKEKSGNWLVIDVTAIDGRTGAPAQGIQGKLCYVQSSMFGSYSEGPVNLGLTGTDGKLHVEWKIPRNTNHYYFNYYPSGIYENPMFPSSMECNLAGYDVGHEVHPNQLNIINLVVYPTDNFRFHIRNDNCFDANDSIIADFEFSGGPYGNSMPYSNNSFSMKFVGCTDTLVPTNSYAGLTFSPDLKITRHVYKNGNYSTSVDYHTFEFDGQIDTIQILY